MDKSGNLAVGFSLSGTGNRPSVHFNGRLANDPINQLTLGEGTIIDGNGSQNGGLSRWGDYSSMSVDPVDGCTFWYANEYLPATGSFNWRTRLASFSLPGCGSVQPNDFSIAANPTTVTVNAGSSGGTTISTAVVSGSPESIALSASGLPAGATASFSPPTVTAGNSSTMTIQTSSSTPAGTSSVTVTGTAASATHSTTVGLTVNAVVAGGIVNGDFESGAFNGWTRTGTSSITNSNPHSGSFAAMLGSSSPSALSTLVQTFTAPNGASQLSVFYLVACNDTVSNDFAAIRVKDNTTGTTTTILPNTCTNDGIWTQVTTSVVAGHSYTLTLANKDNGAAGTATFTKFDDITLS
jgi:hypothetical protein